MTDKPFCSHGNVQRKSIGVGGGQLKEIWQCVLCGQIFKPENLCIECELYEDKKCYHKNGACSTQKGLYQNFTPRGNNMTEKRVIFESEEEAINFIENCIAFKGDIENLNINKSLLLIKSKGYIRCNPVEEAGEILMLKDIFDTITGDVYLTWEQWDKIVEAIQYLQNQIDELNKKVGEI